MRMITLSAFSSLGTKLIFILLLFFVLFSLSSVNAADNHTDDGIFASDLVNEDVSLGINHVELDSQALDDSIEEEASQIVEDDSPISNPESSGKGELLYDADLKDGSLTGLKYASLAVDDGSLTGLKDGSLAVDDGSLAGLKDASSTVLDDGSLTDLVDDINGCTGNEYKLKRNYVLNVYMEDYSMPINKNNFTIDGQGHSISGERLSNLLFLNGDNITLKNIKFIDGSAFPCFGFQNLIESVYINGTGSVRNCTFANTQLVAALGFEGIGYVENCIFMDNACEIKGGAVYFRNGGTVKDSSFINNFAPSGAAVYSVGDLVIENGYFKSNFASDGSNVFFSENGTVSVKNITPSYAFAKSFMELNNLIKSGTNIRLNQDYMYMPMGDEERGKAIYLNGIEIAKDNMVIDGRGHTISGEGLVRIFRITANNVTLKNINFLNGFSNGNGGAICLEGRKFNVIIENCNFTNNSAKGNGGAVFGNGTIRNSSFTNNTAEADGGSFCCKIGTVDNCVFSNGMAKNGAGIYAGELTCFNSTFEDDNAKECGGAFYALRDEIKDCTFTNNSANYGGAIYSEEFGAIHKSIFSLNNARIAGGAAYMSHFGPNDDVFDNCTFNKNSAMENGKSLYLQGGAVIGNSYFDGYDAKNEGDVILTLYDLKIKNTIFENSGDDSKLIALRNNAKIIES